MPTAADPAASRPAADRPRADEAAQVMPFRWQTGSCEGQPALMAVRQVITAGETFVQGFVVDSAGLSHWLFERGLPGRACCPGEPRGETEARAAHPGRRLAHPGRSPARGSSGRGRGPRC